MKYMMLILSAVFLCAGFYFNGRNNIPVSYAGESDEKIICSSCGFENLKSDRYCLNCAAEQWVLSEKKVKEIRANNKKLLAQRIARSSVLVKKEKQYIARRKLFGHYHKIFAKLKDAGKLQTIGEKDLKLLTDSIEALYKFRIHYKFDEKLFFKGGRIRSTGKQAGLKEIINVLISLESFFNSYPKKLIQDNLKEVFFVGELTYDGKVPAGFANGRSFWISTKHPKGRFSKKEYLSTIHHEFAHILHGNNYFPEKEWLAINEKDFKYTGSGWSLIGSGDAHKGGKERNKRGFLIKYNEASIQEDIAVFAEWLFVKEDKLLQLAKKYERIRKKHNLILDFYKGLGVKFN